MTTLPVGPPPFLEHLCRVSVDVLPVVSLGDGIHGERRYVPLTGGSVAGEHLAGEVVSGGVDWQWLRQDGTLEIAAHYVVRADDGALIEVSSNGFRHGPAEVMARLGRGDPVASDEYYFRTAITFRTGAPRWSHLASLVAIGCGTRTPDAVCIDVFLVR